MNRDYFLGGNTSKGFFSYYDYLADAADVNKVYIIKGGPGTGKSTTMKQVAKWGEEQGYNVDNIHCSSDPGSLDGVVIREIGVAMVDGTSPHVVDAKNAGAVESIINMGEFWDEKSIKASKNDIMECNHEISVCFKEAYNYLEAAGSINKNCCLPLDKCKEKEVVSNILEDLPSCINGRGKVRKLFADAITPDGIISYADGLCTGKRIVLKSEIYGGAKNITKVLAAKLTEMGYDIELFYSPLNPSDEIRHIVLPSENVCILTSDIISPISEKDAMVVDTDELVECKKFGTDFLKSRLLVISIIQQAVKSISGAKKLHDKLEGFYVPNIDFSAVEKKREKIISEIMEFTHK